MHLNTNHSTITINQSFCYHSTVYLPIINQTFTNILLAIKKGGFMMRATITPLMPAKLFFFLEQEAT